MIDLELRNPRADIGPAQRAALADLKADVDYFWPALGQPVMRAWSEWPTLELRGSAPWLIVPAGRSPQWEPGIRFVLPKQARARLRRLAELRLPLRQLVVGQELDPDGPVRTLLPELTPGPQRCAEALARTLIEDVPAHPGLVRQLGALHWALGGVLPMPRLTPTARAGVVFGVLAPEPLHENEPGLWYELTSWRW
jgi:hypothetical protein